jgi:UDP-glucose:glycoprotein glucosyltransferase
MSTASLRRKKRPCGLSWQLGFLVAALAPANVWASSPSVNVALSASFGSPPYLVELL